MVGTTTLSLWLLLTRTPVANPEICNKGRKSREWGLRRGNPRKFLKFLCKNSALSCKIFACFKIHPVNRGAAAPRLPLESTTDVRRYQLTVFALRSPFVGALVHCPNFGTNEKKTENLQHFWHEQDRKTEFAVAQSTHACRTKQTGSCKLTGFKCYLTQRLSMSLIGLDYYTLYRTIRFRSLKRKLWNSNYEIQLTYS